jgi:Na+-driven multidrug efflux pump
MKLVFIIGALCVIAGWLLTGQLLNIYGIPASTDIFELAFWGFRIYIIGTLLMAYNTFASVLFISLNNGVLPAALSFFRTFVFLVIAYLTLPMLFGLLGAWISMPIAELLAAGMSIYYIRKKRKEYGYA